MNPNRLHSLCALVSIAFASATLAADKEPPVVTPGLNGAPPSDAIVLFDGKDLSSWKGDDNGAPHWKVKDGYAEVHDGGITTKEELYKAFVVFNNSGPGSPFGVHKFQVLTYDGGPSGESVGVKFQGAMPADWDGYEADYNRFANNIFLDDAKAGVNECGPRN